MTKEEFFKSKSFKIILPILIVAMLVSLWRNGYEFGQWLHKAVH